MKIQAISLFNFKGTKDIENNAQNTESKAQTKKDGEKLIAIGAAALGSEGVATVAMQEGKKSVSKNTDKKEDIQRDYKILDDGTKELYTYSGHKYAEELPDGTKRSFFANNAICSEKRPDGTSTFWHNNGQKEYESSTDGTRKLWNEEGKLLLEEFAGGEVIAYDADLSKAQKIIFPDGIEIKWAGGQKYYEKAIIGNKIKRFFANGTICSEERPDGVNTFWYANGQKEYECNPNGTKNLWDEEGNLLLEELPDGKVNAYDIEISMAQKKIFPDGTEIRWNDDGQKLYEKRIVGNKVKRWDSNGQLRYRELMDGSKESYFADGKLWVRKSPTGTVERWDKSGNCDILSAK